MAEQSTVSKRAQPLRIAFASFIFWPEEGGASTVCRELAQAWVRQGHAVTVLAARSSPDLARSETVEGVAIRRFSQAGNRLLGSLPFMVQFRLWLARHRASYDVVGASMLKHAAATGVLACRRSRVPVLVRTEGGGASGDVAWQDNARLGSYIKRVCRRADAVIAISRQIHRELLGADYEPERVRLIPNGVPIPAECWDPQDVGRHRAECGLPERRTICYTGRLRPAKGLEDLVRALPEVEAGLGPTQLVLVGDGESRSSIEQVARDVGVAERVRFVGHVSDVQPYLRASDLYVLPSYVEGLSIALLEATALGMPAVASDIEANRGVLPANLLPLFPIREPSRLAATIVKRLASATNDRTVGVEIRRRTIEQYSIDRVAGAYIDLYRDLIARRQPTPRAPDAV